MIIDERENRRQSVLEAARQIMTAARTAPKGKGIDIIEIVTVTDEDIVRISDCMQELSAQTGMKFLLRDAENILQAEALILIGTRQQVQGLNCAYCGFSACENKPEPVPCAINSIDVGIALGSACAKAADLRLDTRLMFSAGWAARKLGLLRECGQIIAMPLSAASKNPFFDRKPKEEAPQ